MAFINWEEKYSVGIPSIDLQHQKLIGLINQLYEAMREGKGKNILLETLQETIKYTNYHFTTEENLFQKFSYPEEAQHKLIHSKLKQQVDSLYLDVQSGKASLTLEVFNFLKEWVATHILQEDMKYKGKISA